MTGRVIEVTRPGRDRATTGAVRFARFAFPPNALRHCGPDDSHALLEYASAAPLTAPDGAGVTGLIRRFEGAWPYLALIAAAAGRPDPLDPAVVTAYWVGGPLLERIPPRLLAAHLDDRFARRAGRDRADLVALALAGGRPHHNFHVFAVYPWIGLLRAGRSVEPLRVLDSCRVSWGTVVALHGATATVLRAPLTWTADTLALGTPEPHRATLAVDGYPLAPTVRVGDRVALHWDWVCDLLRPAEYRWLRHYTATQLRLVNNATTHPLPLLR